jgi:hypothetical protein
VSGDRRVRALDRYNRLAAPFLTRMVDLRMMFTEPMITAGEGPCYRWTNTAAERLYKSYEDVLQTLMETCVKEEMMPLLPMLPAPPTGPRCDDCAPEFGCWASSAHACRKRPLR